MSPTAVPPDSLVGVVGAGTMGEGVAEVLVRAGHTVLLVDADRAVADAAVGSIGRRLDRDVEKGRLADVDARAVGKRVSVADDVAGLAGAALVVEAVVERLDVKRELVARLEDVLGPDAVIATNTSSLSVSAVGTGLRRPGRLVGLHFFNPAQRMRLVEVVRGEQTDDEVVALARELVRSWDRTPVVCASTPGFVVNRVARPYYGEAQRIVEEGTAPAAVVDAVLRDVGGFPMGPFELTDLIGQDVNLAVSRSVWEQTFHDPRYAPTVLQQRLVDGGRLGRKSGRGVYAYIDGVAQVPHVRVAPACPPPSRVRYRDGWSVMAPLLERVRASGVRVDQVPTEGPDCTDDLGVLLPSGGRLVETSGIPALDVGEDVVVLDWALDPGTTARVAVAPSPGARRETTAQAYGLLQAAGVEVVELEDGPGCVVARTVAMLVNEAADLVARGEATASDVDVAMRLGAGHPVGPLEWGDRLGASCVAEVLQGLHDAMPTGRYRVAPAVHRAAETGGPLRV